MRDFDELYVDVLHADTDIDVLLLIDGVLDGIILIDVDTLLFV